MAPGEAAVIGLTGCWAGVSESKSGTAFDTPLAPCRVREVFLFPKARGKVENGMKLDQIHHVAIIVSDYQRARAFYVEQLGLPILRENYRADRGDWKLDLKLGDGELEIFAIPGAPQRPSYPEAQGLRHLAFRVENVEEAVRELEARGIACEPIRWDPYTNCRMTFFHDPDGLPLELHE